jgi:hypothetical protein
MTLKTFADCGCSLGCLACSLFLIAIAAPTVYAPLCILEADTLNTFSTMMIYVKSGINFVIFSASFDVLDAILI